MSGTFPLASKQDSKYYEVIPEDPSISTGMEGGYDYSRPRFTRTPRKSYKTGFTHLTNADRAIIQAFWDLNMGGSDSFTWTDPVDLQEKTVRFDGPLSFKYAGVGGTHRWNISDIKLVEI